MDNETVCALVVTYNRKELLIECLEALENQSRPLDAIYIIDNASLDGTPELLLKKSYIKEIPPIYLTEPYEMTYKKNRFIIHYVIMNENTGGAGGFYEGVKRAYEKGYDWIWLMDDDVEPHKNCLDKLLQKKSISKVLVPLKLSKNGEIDGSPAIKYNLKNPFLLNNRETITDKFSRNEIPEIIEIQDFSFEGPLINSSIIKKIGFPKKDLFYYGDDTDYSLKISYGLKKKIILVTDALMYRKLNDTSYVTPKWKQYYIARNTNFILWVHGQNILVKLKPIVISLLGIGFNLIKLNKENIYIWYCVLTDFWKKKLPLRFKPN